jgi:spermidine synthase
VTDDEECPGSIGAGIGLTSLALMHTQIVLTRIFSVVVWYHFAFFAISVALLGLSASAIVVHAFGARVLGARTPRLLSLAALVFGASVLLLGVLVLHATPDWFGAGVAASFTTFTPKLLAIFFATMTPFFLGGFALSLALSRWTAAIHRNYAYDLCGAALACAVVIPVLDALGGPKALLVSAACAVLAALAFAAADTTVANLARRLAPWAAFGAVIVGSGVAASSAGAFDVRIAKGIDLHAMVPEFSRWNSFSLVSVFPSWNFRGWGTSPKYAAPVPAQKALVIDMNAFTPLLAFDGDLAKVEFTRFDLSALAFVLHPALERTCIVGSGGGKDVLASLASGARHVTAVEVNPLIATDVMRGAYQSFTGSLYRRSDVELHVEDGRSFLRRSSGRYDVILISMVDTSAATAAGAYALAENTLYTADAFSDFMDHLAPGGILTVSSVSLKGLAVGARLASLARAALTARGVDPSTTVAVVQTPWLTAPEATMNNVLIKPSGFTAEDRRALVRATDDLGFQLGYLPGRAVTNPTPEQGYIARILDEKDEATLARERDSWPLDVSPVGDDRPYFFYQNRFRDGYRALVSAGDPHLFGNGLAVLLKVLLAAIVMVAGCILLPLFWMRRHAGNTRPLASWDLPFVACLGLGYMFVEIALIQRFLPYLGTPTHALTAVLLVMLLSGGLGARAFGAKDARAKQRLFIALVVYAIFVAVAFPYLAHATMGLPLGARAVIVAVFLAPLGAMMGVPLPSCLAAVRARDAGRVPWLWGVNGAASVLGSVLATLGSMHAGITALLAAGIALYACVALLWPKLVPHDGVA